MARMDQIETGTAVEDDDADDAVEMWNRMGRIAMFFCLWVGMAIPVLLVISVR